MTPETIERAKTYNKRNEGCKLFVYPDTNGYPTIGRGHKLKNAESFPNGISQESADLLYEGDFKQHLYSYYQLEKHLELGGIGEWRKIALFDMVYQMGLAGVMAFGDTLKYLIEGAYTLAGIEVLDSKYFKKDTPKRAKRTSWILITNSEPPKELWK